MLVSGAIAAGPRVALVVSVGGGGTNGGIDSNDNTQYSRSSGGSSGHDGSNYDDCFAMFE